MAENLKFLFTENSHIAQVLLSLQRNS